MTSGIASYTFNKKFQNELFSNPESVWTPEELAQIGIEDSPEFDPGTEFQYSNTNTVLLGLILEQVTGKPIGALYCEQIIEPLGLKDTSFPPPQTLRSPIRTRKATPSKAKKTESPPTLPTGTLPGGLRLAR